MTVSYRLRPATADDAEAIAALHTASWRRTYRGMMPDAFLDGGALENRRRVWRERLGSPNRDQHVVVAESESRLVGFICTFAREDEGWGAYIDNLHVAHEWQGRGGGSAPNCRYVWRDPRLLITT
jgi:hypothetical protein